MQQLSIYMLLLGEDFMSLAPELQRVHGAEPSLRARGQVTVTHGRGPLVRLLNWVNRVPAPGPAQRLGLLIQRMPDKEVWIRHFGETELRTTQWAENGYFIEAAGPVKMAMRISAVRGGIIFEPVRTWILGIPVPKWMGVEVSAKVLPLETGWDVLVETKSAMIGLLFRYEGHIALEPWNT